MNDLSVSIWDGVRPRLRRDIVAHRRAGLGRLDVVAATENLASATDWCLFEDGHRIVVHIDGRLDRMECEFSDGPSGARIPDAGDIWIVPAGCRYAALAQGERARFVELAVPTAVLDDRAIIAQVGFRDAFLAGAAQRLYRMMMRDDDVAGMAAHGIAHAIDAHLGDILAGRPAMAAGRGRALATGERGGGGEATHPQLDAPHSLDALAAVAGMGVRQFTAAFRAAFGVTPWQYILHARLDHAAGLLRRSDAPVTDIALATGFATPSHFATAFARHYGAPPSRFRKAAREQG